MKAKELRDMSVAELQAKFKELKDELFRLRFQHAINQLDNPHVISDTKKDIARVMTVLRQKQSDASKNA
ncbi:MAG: 50S ribosomal protein L29 [Eubacteriales bacterium]|nr:50S ribosomal protein L29 [Eubacteriales bacterium]